MKTNKKKILIIGLGSIGQKYLIEALKKNLDCYAYDLKTPNIPIKNFTFLYSFHDLKKKLLKYNFNYAVVSTWADSHYRFFKLLTSHSIRNLIIEKPICSSLDELRSIKKILSKKKIKLFSNYRWRLIDIKNKVKFISKKNNLGKLLSINSVGGAFCFSTGGYHILDLIKILSNLKSQDIHISSNINFDKINPRDKKFFVLDGNINLFSSRSKFSASLNYSNQSYLSPIQILSFKDSIMYMTIDGKFEIYSTKNRDNLGNKPITRYTKFDKLIDKGNFINLNFNPTKLSLDNMIENNKLSDESLFFPQEALFCAIYANKYKKTMNMNTLKYLSKFDVQKKWSIT